VLKQYTFKVLITILLVGAGLILVHKLALQLSFVSVVFILILFSFNSWFAIAPFYFFKSTDPFKIFVAGALIRNLTVGIIICLYYYLRLKNDPVFLISCLFAFVSFQFIEVLHLLKDRNIFSTKK